MSEVEKKSVKVMPKIQKIRKEKKTFYKLNFVFFF